ncbi:hypothetical protein QJQ45_003165 [Haematococcus lacustris]|nr:hypothetical protein QJQ45_003165 [Haematococcus lacustris]
MKGKKHKGVDGPKQPNPKVPKPKPKGKPDSLGWVGPVSPQGKALKERLEEQAKSRIQYVKCYLKGFISGKPTDRVPGRVVTVDEFRTSRVSSILNSPQPCEEALDSSKPTRPEDWKPKPGHPGDLGKWVDRDCNAALNLQRAGESKWRPLELCRWPHRGRLPAQGEEYPAMGFKKLQERGPRPQPSSL